MSIEERRNKALDLPEEPEAMAEEQTEAEALRRMLDGDEPGDALTPEVAETVAFLQASQKLPTAEQQQARVVQTRDEVLRRLAQAPRRESGVWERLTFWKVLAPLAAVGATAAVLVMLTRPMQSVPEAPAQASLERVQTEQAPEEKQASRLWNQLPQPPKSLLATQAKIAATKSDGLQALRAPMAEYRRMLYSTLSARYWRQAQADSPASPIIEVASRWERLCLPACCIEMASR